MQPYFDRRPRVLSHPHHLSYIISDLHNSSASMTMDLISTFNRRIYALLASLLLYHIQPSQPQQTYVNNKQLDCYNNYTNTNGFICNSPQPSCQSYLTFRSSSAFNYNTPTSISYLLSSDPYQISKLNNFPSVVYSIPDNTLVLVPINCSCSGGKYFQRNTTYHIQSSLETYFSIANNTYQGLTTCQALIAQNPDFKSGNLTVDVSLQVPLMCACPTTNQTQVGFSYLLSYLVTWGDSIDSIAQTFGLDNLQVLLDANELSSNSIIYPFTPLLVPLNSTPTVVQTTVSPPPPPPPSSPAATPANSGSSNKWVFVGIGIGAAILVLAVVVFIVWFYRRRSVDLPPPKPVSGTGDYHPAPQDPKSCSVSVSSEGVRSAIESLTVYKFEELQKATGFFSDANRIKGSVYRGSFKGDDAAVKIMKGDVSSEINILKSINHSNVIRLSGFCVNEGNTYLVYEFADNGSLSDWIHPVIKKDTNTINWKQRVQIAYDVADALNYLHNYTNPPYIHKNLKSSNILLDTNLRAKVGNFGLARTVENEEEGGFQLTRHVVGTQGYMPPEYIENGVITPKMDVFAFGVVLLELLSGREATTTTTTGAATTGGKKIREELLWTSISVVLDGENVREKLARFIDPSLNNEYPLDLAFSLAQLAHKCVAHDINSRPQMDQVFITLSKILSSSLDWDPSDQLESSRSFSIASR